MANSNSVMIHKLQNAINGKGYKILYSTSQFYSDQQKRPVTQYYIKQVYDIPEEEQTKTRRHKYIELFKSCSQIQIVLFLRDYWYNINGWEVPTDNKMWNEAKQKYYDKLAEE